MEFEGRRGLGPGLGARVGLARRRLGRLQLAASETQVARPSKPFLRADSSPTSPTEASRACAALGHLGHSESR
eukprot:15456419-Alexandrium_andersonii.AAC.1